MSEHKTEVLKTHLKGSWVAKMAVFFVVLLGLAGWGYMDAAVVYPARGREVVEYTKMQYLNVAQGNNILFRASVEDPATEHARLMAKEVDSLTQFELGRREWLTSISRIASLEKIELENRAEMQRRVADPSSAAVGTETLFVSPSQTLADLTAALSNQSVPKPLKAFDIPVQWMICIAGLAGAAWVGFLFLKAKSTSFSYKPETHELTLPGGRAFTPEMLEVVDKRKWDKFFVFLKVQGIGGEIKLDLLKFVPLEDWILEMEKLSPNYEPEEEAGEGGLADDGAGDAAEAEPKHAESA